MTTVVAVASHDIAVWMKLSVRLIEALLSERWKVPGLGRGML